MTTAYSLVLIGRWILSSLILLAPAVGIRYALPEYTGMSLTGIGIWAGYVAVWLVLLLIAKYVEFYPDTDDLGWCGGVVDDPLSWSDDKNRLLLACKWFFAIPKFVLKTFSDTLKAV
jgi:hypothetical protein